MDNVLFAEKFQNVLTNLNKKQLVVMLSLIRGLTLQNVSEIREELIELLNSNSMIAGELTAVLFEELTNKPAHILEVDKKVYDKSVRYGLTNFTSNIALVERQLAGIFQRHVFNASRETMLESCTKTKTKWARYASVNACSFCRMLAIRGFVYNNEINAAKSHNRCHCVVIPITEEFTVPDYYNVWEKQYEDAVQNTVSSEKNKVLKNWNKLI